MDKNGVTVKTSYVSPSYPNILLHSANVRGGATEWFAIVNSKQLIIDYAKGLT
jgi:hypothetical protein